MNLKPETGRLLWGNVKAVRFYAKKKAKPAPRFSLLNNKIKRNFILKPQLYLSFQVVRKPV
jgi:hypothetical protein